MTDRIVSQSEYGKRGHVVQRANYSAAQRREWARHGGRYPNPTAADVDEAERRIRERRPRHRKRAAITVDELRAELLQMGRERRGLTDARNGTPETTTPGGAHPNSPTNRAREGRR